MMFSAYNKFKKLVTGWETLSLADGNISASYVKQQFAMSCVPTCVAMLSWNLGYGLGLESSAVREAYIIAKPSSPRSYSHQLRKNYISIKKVKDMTKFYEDTGLKVDQVGTLLAQYGLQYELYQNLGVIATNIPKKLTTVCNSINSMKDGDAALLIAYDGTHCVLLYKRSNYHVLLDPRDIGSCNATNKREVATVKSESKGQHNDNKERIIFVEIEQGSIAPMITDIFFVKNQSLVRKIWNSKSNFSRKKYLSDDWF